MAEDAQRLRLLIEDAEDVNVVSAALQDAVAKVGDIRHEPRGRLLTIALNRYRWEADGRRAGGQRIRSALQIASVLSVKARRIRRDPKDAVVSLLAVGFEPGEAPAGTVVLSFSGDADLRIEVECLDGVLADVSEPWATPRTPSHADG